MFSLCSLTGKTWHLWELVDRTVVCCVWCIGDIFNLQHSKLVERSLCPCYGSFDFTQEVSGGIKKTTSTNAPVILGDDFWAVSLVPSNEPTLKRAVTEICEESGVCFLWSHLRHVNLVSASADVSFQPPAALHIHGSHLLILPLMKPPLS